MRRPIKRRVNVYPDERYSSEDVSRLVNYVMLNGQKQTALKIVYAAFEAIKAGEGAPDPLEIFNQAVRNASPLMEVRSRRVGGANYQVPREVRPERRMQLAHMPVSQCSSHSLKNSLPLRKKKVLQLRSAMTCTKWQKPTEHSPTSRGRSSIKIPLHTERYFYVDAQVIYSYRCLATR